MENFKGKVPDLAGPSVYERVSNAIKKRYSSTFSEINKTEESEVPSRQIASATGQRRRGSAELSFDDFNPLPYN